MAVVLTDAGPVSVAPRDGAGEGLWLGAADAERATGWTLKPEGMCRADICVPLPPEGVRADEHGRAVDVAAFWRRLGNPVLHDAAREAWVLGAGATERADALASLEAPDFALPDLAGRLHRLSDLRGRKVFLVSWAPW